MLFKSLTIPFLLLLFVSTASAGTYTVSPDGTGADYSILQAKTYAANNTGEDITFLLAGGAYGNFTDSRTTSQTNWVRYKAASGQTPVFDKIVIGEDSGNSLNAYIEFDSIDIADGIEIRRRNYVNVKNCDITTANYHDGRTRTAVNGVWVSGNEPNYVTIDNCEIHDTYRGINAGGHYWTITNNNIHTIAEDGIHSGGSNSLIKGNEIWDVDRRHARNDMPDWDDVHSDGIQWISWDSTHDTIFSGNNIHTGEMQGLFLSAVNGGWNNITVENNFVHNINTGSSYMPIGSGINNLRINNNTVVKTGVGGPTVGIYSNMTEMYNNIFGGIHFGGTTIFSQGNNLFNGIPDKLTPNSTDSVLILKDFEALFVNYGSDFHLAPNSLAINFGNPAYGPSTDIEGNIRTGDPDAGAYEYGASACTTAAECNDGRYCNGEETCNLETETCQQGAAPCTDDGYSCTQLCNETTKQCNVTNNALCNDQNPCTNDSCIGPGGDAGTGCSYTFNTSQCNDGIDCTTQDKCTQGTCQGITQNELCPEHQGCDTKTCTLTGCVYTPAGCAIPPGLVMYLPFNGDTQDHSTYGNHGIFPEGTPNYVQGKVGQALEFNGANNYIETAESADFDFSGTQALTHTTWVKLDELPSTGKYSSITMTSETGQDGTNHDKGLMIDSSGKAIFYVYDGALKLATSTTNLTTGTWYHLAGTYNGNNLAIFINGTEEDSITAISTHNFTSPQIVLSFRNGNTSSPWNNYTKGTIDEIKIYSRALTSQEILTQYNQASQQCIDITALLGYISSWKQGSLSMLSLMQRLEQWKAGTGCP